jgi:hypothetical protein
MTTDPLYANLLRERFGKSTWFTARPEGADSKLMQYMRQLELEAAARPDNEEVSDGSVEEAAVRDPAA